jgi:Glycosyl hydrolases family 16
MFGTPLPLVSVVVVVLAFAALTSVSIAGAVPQPGGSTDTTITIAGLNCDTNYRVRINPVGASGKPATLLIRTQPCASPPLPSSGVITIEGLNCDTDYRISIDPVGVSGKPVTLLIRTQPCASPPPPEPPPSQEPGPIAGQGYTRVFADEFDVLNRGVWCNRQWWETAPPAGTQYVQDGILHVVTRRTDGYKNSTISSEPCGQANPKSFKQGYFEARMRWTAGNGSSPAFWLFSTRHATNSVWPDINPVCAQQGLPRAECLTSELDVFEGQGHQPSTYIGTLHRNTSGFYGEPNVFCQGVPTQNIGVNMTTGFHTYAARWTLNDVRWYLDGTLLGSCPTYDSTNQPMHLLFYQWPQSWTRDPDASSPNELHTEVDWVRVWHQ